MSENDARLPEDTEGHLVRKAAGLDDEDTEGHLVRKAAGHDEDTEGHLVRK